MVGKSEGVVGIAGLILRVGGRCQSNILLRISFPRPYAQHFQGVSGGAWSPTGASIAVLSKYALIYDLVKEMRRALANMSLSSLDTRTAVAQLWREFR